jgi:hypothetical protein
MPKPFDAAMKLLLETYPADWVRCFGGPTGGPVQVIDADLSTVTTGADKVFRIGGAVPWLLHLEMQAGPDRRLGGRMLKYNVLLHDRHDLPVQSVAVLLRPKADTPGITGIVQRHLPDGLCYHEFHYDVVRVWQQPVESILAGGLGTLPLAPLSSVTRNALPAVVHRMEERLSRETGPHEAESLWTTTYVLMGLRYPLGFAAELLKGVRKMEESVTYQAIVAEGVAKGRTDEARRLLLRQGRKRFGTPDSETAAAVEAINNLDRLEELSERLLDVSSWEELLAPPRSRRRNGRSRKSP